MNKNIFLIALIPFIFLFALSIFFTYQDNRPTDRSLTFGFPLTMYSQTLNRGCEINPEACAPKINYLFALINIAIIYLVSLMLIWFYRKTKQMS
ncbi:MAG: hypothetical protein WC758_03995 [Candidatus Woesearchaeota archaeon]|jgi:hypothetical protein